MPRAGRFSIPVTRAILLYALYTFALFAIFTIALFPHELLVRRALESARNPLVAVDITGARFAWLRGYELQGFRVAPLPLREGIPPLLEWSRLRVRPDYASWLKGNLYSFVVSGELYGGRAEGWGSLRGGRFEGALRWDAVELRRYRALLASLQEGEISGSLAGSCNITYGGANPRIVQGTGQFVLTRGALEKAKVDGFALPDLHFRDAAAKLSLRAALLEVQEFSANGDELNVQASGTVTLEQPLLRSGLNLKVTLHPTAASPESFRALLGVLAAYLARPVRGVQPVTFTVTGTLQSPQLR